MQQIRLTRKGTFFSKIVSEKELTCKRSRKLHEIYEKVLQFQLTGIHLIKCSHQMHDFCRQELDNETGPTRTQLYLTPSAVVRVRQIPSSEYSQKDALMRNFLLDEFILQMDCPRVRSSTPRRGAANRTSDLFCCEDGKKISLWNKVTSGVSTHNRMNTPSISQAEQKRIYSSCHQHIMNWRSDPHSTSKPPSIPELVWISIQPFVTRSERT